MEEIEQNTKKQLNTLGKKRFLVFTILLLTGLYRLSYFNYPLFHSAVELFTIVISCSVFILSTITTIKEKNAFSILGIGYLCVGIMDFLHVITFHEINIIGMSQPYAVQFWICARFTEAANILLFLFLLKHKKVNLQIISAFIVLFSATLLSMILYFKIFPACLTPEQNYTSFKIAAEICICLLFVVSFLLVKTREYIKDNEIQIFITFSIVTALSGEFFFIFHLPEPNRFYSIGLLLRLISFIFIYKSILIFNINNPLEIIYSELYIKISETESLNHQLAKREEDYKALSEELELIVDNIPGVVFYKDKNNNFIKVNKYMANAHRKQKREIEGHNLLTLYNKNDAEKYFKDDIEIIKSGKPKLNIEEKWKTEKGDKWININKIPIFDQKESITGILGVAMDITKKKEYEEEILKLLTEIETEKNTALKNSFTDSLTGVYNRRYFNEMMHKEIAIAKREKHNLSIIMTDIDYFKYYNDYYGHIAGDKCLQATAIALQAILNRATDTFARFGGEEFIAILENTDKEGALIIANAMKEAVYNLHIEHSKSKCSKYVTISLGVTTISDFNFSTPDYPIKLADTALYKAKNSGRNRTEFQN